MCKKSVKLLGPMLSILEQQYLVISTCSIHISLNLKFLQAPENSLPFKKRQGIDIRWDIKHAQHIDSLLNMVRNYQTFLFFNNCSYGGKDCQSEYLGRISNDANINTRIVDWMKLIQIPNKSITFHNKFIHERLKPVLFTMAVFKT